MASYRVDRVQKIEGNMNSIWYTPILSLFSPSVPTLVAALLLALDIVANKVEVYDIAR